MTSAQSVTKCSNCGQPRTAGANCPHCGSPQTSGSVSAAGEMDPCAAPQIAIIGTEGSGKTVLITVLAKRFSHISADGLFLNPLDGKTIKYVESAWHTLNSGEWPAGSPLGQLFELQWELRSGVHAQVGCRLRLADSAGQDLRRIFSDDDVETAARLPAHLQTLTAYCRNADIVICLVNLKDFLGEGDQERRTESQLVIKAALQRLSAPDGHHRRFWLLFTQVDQYQAVRRKHGTWAGVAKEHLPYVYGAHVANHQVMVGAVAAVHDTQVVVDPDGMPRRVPKPGFTSRGLDEIMKWLASETKLIAEARSAELQRAKALEAERLKAQSSQERFPDSDRQPDFTLNWIKSRLALGSMKIRKYFAIGLVTLIGLGFYSTWASPPPPWQGPQLSPSPELACNIEYGTIWSNFLVTNKSRITLRDAVLAVDVVSEGQLYTTRTLRYPQILHGETHTFRTPGRVPKGSNCTLRAMQFAPIAAAWGVTYGRWHNYVWLRNDSENVVRNIELKITVGSGRSERSIKLGCAVLRPHDMFSRSHSLSANEPISATITSWQE